MRIVGVVALPYNISANRCPKVFNLFRRENIAEANMEQKFLPGSFCGNASKLGHFATYGLSKSVSSGAGILRRISICAPKARQNRTTLADKSKGTFVDLTMPQRPFEGRLASIYSSSGATDSVSNAARGRNDDVLRCVQAQCSSLGLCSVQVPNKVRNERLAWAFTLSRAPQSVQVAHGLRKVST